MFLAVVTCLLGMAANRAEDTGAIRHAPRFNSMGMGRAQHISEGISLERDTETELPAARVLLLNYSAYDSLYAAKVRSFVERRRADYTLSDCWDGSAENLAALLENHDAVIVPYPSGGAPAVLRAYGKVLQQYAQQGGTVIFTGTHQYNVLREYGLLDITAGYFCDDQDVLERVPEHPLLEGTSEIFHPTGFTYPLDIADAQFVSVADVRGFPVVGYKPLGAGRVIYLGFEYYYDEPVSSRILTNAIAWAAASKPVAAAPAAADTWAARSVKRSEEVLFAGGGRSEQVELKIYPNPYVEKAFVELELEENSVVAAEMNDESGRLVATLLPSRSLSTGQYRFELPNISPGVYFVRCTVDGRTTVRKVVKTAP